MSSERLVHVDTWRAFRLFPQVIGIHKVHSDRCFMPLSLIYFSMLL